MLSKNTLIPYTHIHVYTHIVLLSMKSNCLNKKSLQEHCQWIQNHINIIQVKRKNYGDLTCVDKQKIKIKIKQEVHEIIKYNIR